MGPLPDTTNVIERKLALFQPFTSLLYCWRQSPIRFDICLAAHSAGSCNWGFVVVCNIFFISRRNFGWTTTKRRVSNMSTAGAYHLLQTTRVKILYINIESIKSDVVWVLPATSYIYLLQRTSRVRVGSRPRAKPLLSFSQRTTSYFPVQHKRSSYSMKLKQRQN